MPSYLLIIIINSKLKILITWEGFSVGS